MWRQPAGCRHTHVEVALDNESTRQHGPVVRGLLRAIGWLRIFDKGMHYVAGAALLAILALTVADITFRFLFNNPVSGTVEVTAAVLVVVVYLGLAYSEDLGDHITVDLIYERIGPRTRVVFDYFAWALSVVVLSLMSFQLYHFALRQRESGAQTPVLEWPIWPFAIVAAFGTALYAVAVLAKIVLKAAGEPTEAQAALTLGEVTDTGPEI